MDSADRAKLLRIDAKIAEIEGRPAAERQRLAEMLKALQAARSELIRWTSPHG